MNYYKVKFRLANDDKANEIILEDYEGYFKEAMKNFNKSGEVARTYKKILFQNIRSTFIEIFFECEVALKNPTMVFRNYSKFIIKTFKDTEDWITKSGNFLKGIEAKEISQSETSNIEILDIKKNILSDKEMIKDIIDMCIYPEIETSEEKKNRIRIINKIKFLVLEYRSFNNK